ncbi:hypothetical protein LshimejAT787_0700540 [Lyophyllum shimeji]|uniref:Uncharacterized protein n=1 Tax=Lyophyllum shimeji TaxID=47721 RepID=A0A9P3PQ47_LYOSH|nr:hypothetical protein LshimejAT787_0700540 [Lyophyllum shimeji]
MPPPPPATSVDVLVVLFDTIAAYIPLLDLVAFSRAHRRLMNELFIHLRHLFDELLTSRISRDNVNGFRALLLKTRAAISGSTALHFVLREKHWDPGDFDLYAPFGTGYTIVHWLITNEGYKIVSDGSKSFTFHPHTVPVPADGTCDWLTDLGHAPAAHRTRRGSKTHYEWNDSDIYRVYKLCSTKDTFIDVIESSKPSFLAPITKFHSTVVMNYLTPDEIVVLYPDLTFRREGILQYRDANTVESYDDPNQQQAPETGRKQDYLKKYKSRGFTLYSRPADLLRSCGAACPALRRTAVDEWTFRLKIAPDPGSSSNSIRLPPISATTASPDISGSEEMGEASNSQESRSSWSYVTEFTALSIQEGEERHTTSTPPSHDLVCTRPSLPVTHWTLQTPPPASPMRPGRRRRNAVHGQHPSSSLYTWT